MTSDDPRIPAPSGADVSVETLMSRIASGDRAAVFTLAEFHGHRVAATVRRQLRRCGVERIAPEDLHGLVLDACIALIDVAGAWRPGGAAPWNWAEGRVLNVVAGWVGLHADALDEHERVRAERAVEQPASVLDEAVSETLARLVAEEPIVGLLMEACSEVRVDEPALCCMLEYRIQQDQGDPSPAHTLAERYGCTPEALRQRVSRNRRRLRRLAADDPRFAAVADLVLVA